MVAVVAAAVVAVAGAAAVEHTQLKARVQHAHRRQGPCKSQLLARSGQALMRAQSSPTFQLMVTATGRWTLTAHSMMTITSLPLSFVR